MDDMKREAYMLARGMIDRGEEMYICLALHRALSEVAGGISRGQAGSTKQFVTEYFSEFLSLNDGVRWVHHVGEGVTPTPIPEWDVQGWWEWTEPADLPFSQVVTETYIQHIKDAVKGTLDARLRAIDFLLGG